MKAFMDEHFLLKNETAKRLYHQYAEHMPIIDYHCHLSAKDIWENRPAENITQIWLGDDHYKWRLMRQNGEPEAFVSGQGGDKERFMAFARTLPYAAGNPVFHWTHLELQRYFGIRETLNEVNAEAIWSETLNALSDGKHTPQTFIEQSNVYALCTTEDPADTLEYHEKLAKWADFKTKVLPAMRPDAALAIEKAGWRAYLARLGECAGVSIHSIETLKQAILIRMDAFDACGCVASDHGFEYMPDVRLDDGELNDVFAKALRGETLSLRERDGYKTELMLWLAAQYHRRGWAMELHVGALRDANQHGVKTVGEAKGYDTVGDAPTALPLSHFLNALEERGELPKTILFNLNEQDNTVLSALTGTFHEAGVPGKMQFGTAWWFQDHKDGMEKQLHTLADHGLLGRFIGMLTDSRSFLSYTRHEYFRRIFCNFLGELVEKGNIRRMKRCWKKWFAAFALKMPEPISDFEKRGEEHAGQ